MVVLEQRHDERRRYATYGTGLGLIAHVTNSGLVTGARALQAERFATVDTITNSGTMSGSDYALVLNGLTNSHDNHSTGRLAATLLDGVRIEGRVMNLSNSDVIAGGSDPDSAGMFLAASGTVATLANGGFIDGVRGLVVRDSGSIGSLTTPARCPGPSTVCTTTVRARSVRS